MVYPRVSRRRGCRGSPLLVLPGVGGSRATAGRGVLPRGKPANACQLFDWLGSREVGELAGQAEGARAGGRDEV